MTLKETIELFDEKFNRLNQSSLIKYMIANGIHFVFNCAKNDIDKKAKFPSLEMIESYVLNLRFFIQKNEPISIINLSKIYEENKVEKELKGNFILAREIFNNELDKYCPFMPNNKKVTYREMFDGMIYAILAHSNREKHKDFFEMTKGKFGYYLAMDTFLRCIDFIHTKLAVINYLNKKAFS